jgi:hypothetical protein
LAIVGAVALFLWAVSELWEGVSPFRRLLASWSWSALFITAAR